jgi:Uncharacterized conserved protein (DUF2190)
MAKTPASLNGTDVSFRWANASAATSRFLVVYPTSTSGDVDFCTGVTQFPIGIMQDKPAAQYDSCAVRISGWSYVVAGSATIAVGDRLGSDSAGRAVPVTKKSTFEASTFEYSFGVALTASTTIGEWITCHINVIATDLT